MVRTIIKHTGGCRIFILIYRRGRKSSIIEYNHNLGAVHKTIYEEKSFHRLNYTTKDRDEQVQRNKELLEKIKSKGGF